MKKVQINTNLPPRELEAISKGLNKLASSKRDKPLHYENAAERSIVEDSAHLVQTAAKSLLKEFKSILTEG